MAKTKRISGWLTTSSLKEQSWSKNSSWMCNVRVSLRIQLDMIEEESKESGGNNSESMLLSYKDSADNLGE